MTSARQQFWAGVRAELPILLGTTPFGLIYGVLALGAGIPPLLAQAMSAIIFAGSAQFVTAQLISAGAPPLVLLMTGFIVNVRHALYSASVAPYTRHLRPVWKWVLAYLMTDEAYAVTITHYHQTGDAPYNHWFFFGAGLTLWSSWQISTAIGIALGAQVPASWGLDFTLALTFIALVVPALKDRAGLAAAVVAGVIAVVAADAPYKLGLVGATLIGIAVGVLLERRTTSVAPADPALAHPDT